MLPAYNYSLVYTVLLMRLLPLWKQHPSAALARGGVLTLLLQQRCPGLLCYCCCCYHRVAWGTQMLHLQLLMMNAHH